MRILVTGAGGFIGSHFIERALADDHEIIGIHRSDRPSRRKLFTRLRTAGADLRRGDLLVPDSLHKAIRGADVVCHFAAAFTEAGANEEYFHRVNVLGTRNVATAAARCGVRRFVHCSTAGIYGRQVGDEANEQSPPRPWNSYERTKLESELALEEVARAHEMEYVILRPTVVYGPRDARMRKLFDLVARGRFPLFGSGTGRRHLVHVHDVADAFLKACSAPGAANRDMIIAGPEAIPLRQLLDLIAGIAGVRSHGPRLPLTPMLAVAALTEDICKMLHVDPPLHRRRMDFYRSDATFDTSRARELLAWEPRIGLADGLARTLDAYRADDASNDDAAEMVRARGRSSGG